MSPKGSAKKAFKDIPEKKNWAKNVKKKYLVQFGINPLFSKYYNREI